MRILIVGAGSIGQLYGFVLQRGGADVDVYVRPDYLDEAREGYRLYDRRKKFRISSTFRPESAFSKPDEIEGQSYDVVLICISSTGLRGEWIKEFAPATAEATFASLTPGLKDREFLEQYVDKERLVTGLITAVSYPAPLPGEEVDEPGTAYWLPPLTPAFFDGPADRVKPLLKALKQGGMSARKMRRLPERASFGSALLVPFVAVLETMDWSFDELRTSKEARETLDRCVDEALEAVEMRFDARRPLPTKLLGPFGWRCALRFAPVPPPFDLETYLKVHFTKVGDQTRMMLQDYIDERAGSELDSPALEELLERLSNL